MNIKSVWQALAKIKDPMIRAYIENALQEQSKREKGCEYCNGESLKSLEVTHIFGMPKLAFNGGNVPVYDADKPTFCPNCGRRLK